jgi:shikimate dehydrogenase
MHRNRSGLTSHAFVIGQPIAHSISPAIHNAAFAALGIDAVYEAVAVAGDELARWVESVRSPGTLGFNVTLPHKQTIIPFLDQVEGDGLLTGSVNAVVVAGDADGRTTLTGTNTDTVGFRRMLAEEADQSLHNQRVLLLGAGGGARAVALVALQDGAAELVVVNRTLARAEKLLADLSPTSSRTAASAVSADDPRLADLLAGASTVVNATSVGLASQEMPTDPTPIRPSALVVDLIYNPLETAFLQVARLRGARVVGGLGMLVHQAAAAFERWTGMAAPLTVMRASAESALRQRMLA